MSQTDASSWNKILFHINYFEQGQTLEEACRLARELGGDGIEFRRKPLRSELAGSAYLDELARAIDKHPLEWVSFGAPGPDFMSSDAAVRERELESAISFYTEAAGRFPLKVVNTMTGRLANPDSTVSFLEYEKHGSALAIDEQWTQAIEGFKVLGAHAEKLGFRFAFETHGVYLHDSLEATLKLVRSIGSPAVGLLWDQLNLMLFPSTPPLAEAVELCGEDLFYVHLKNALVPPRQFLACCDLDAGIINIREQVKLLKAAGYQGPWCIEAPRPGDRVRFAKKDLAYLREVLAEV